MALSTLKFRPGHKQQELETTKKGAPIYKGEPSRFHDWEFAIELRMAGLDVEQDGPKEFAINAQQVMDGLRGDAYKVAKRMGVKALCETDGIPKLVTAMREFVFPSKKLEAKELYTHGHAVGQTLSRQSGESMLSYCARRREWWDLLKEMDDTVGLSQDILGDLLLDNSNLGKAEKLLVLTSTQNKTDFELVAKALQDQHGKIHLKEDRRGDSGSKPTSFKKPFKKFGTRKPFQRKFHRAGHYGNDDDDEQSSGDKSSEAASESPDSQAEQQDDDDASDGEYVENELDAIQINAFTAFLAEEASHTSASTVSDCCQSECVAFMAWNKAGKGQSKGKRKGKSDKFKIRSSPLSLEDRKKRLAKLKKDTRCKDCGEKGHWAGDPECKKHKSHSQKTASYACSSCEPMATGTATFWNSDDSDNEEQAHVACEFYTMDALDSDDDYDQYNSDVGGPAQPIEPTGNTATTPKCSCEYDCLRPGVMRPPPWGYTFDGRNLWCANCTQWQCSCDCAGCNPPDEEEGEEEPNAAAFVGDADSESEWSDSALVEQDVQRLVDPESDSERSELARRAARQSISSQRKFVDDERTDSERDFDMIDINKCQRLRKVRIGASETLEHEIEPGKGLRTVRRSKQKPDSDSEPSHSSQMPVIATRKQLRDYSFPNEGRVQCPDGCKRISKAGSNAYTIRETCKDCGWVTTRKREQSKGFDEATCPHAHVDNRGSTKDEKVFHCLRLRTENVNPTLRILQDHCGPESNYDDTDRSDIHSDQEHTRREAPEQGTGP